MLRHLNPAPSLSGARLLVHTQAHLRRNAQRQDFRSTLYEEIVRRYPVRLEHIPPATFHHARTRNYAAGLAKGEVIVFLSQDAIPSSDNWLAAFVMKYPRDLRARGILVAATAPGCRQALLDLALLAEVTAT